MKQWACLLCVSIVLVGTGQAVAGRCFGVPEAQIVWCDDFDNYCVDGDPWPGYPSGNPPTCPTDGTAVKDNAAFYANWPTECNQVSGLNDGTSKQWNLPFSVIYYGNGTEMQMHTWDFSSVIESRNPGYNAVNGTDENPLIMWFWTRYQTSGAEGNAPQYVELSLGGDHAPTDYVWVDCQPEAQGPYPVICQQNRTWEPSISSICPPLDTTVHAAFAYGTLALLDPNPCDVETGRKPTRYHAVVFDGLQWTEIRSNRFPPGIGDFSLAWNSNLWKVQIKTSTVIVELENSNCAAGFCNATIPRQYTGPFDTISIGTGPACELDVADADNDGILNECVPNTTRKCFDYASDGDPWNGDTGEAWFNNYIDSPTVWDGVLTTFSEEGACCLPDLSCQDGLTQAECEALNGTFQGGGSTCATTLCCHDPFADGDGDGDVDQADFGLWQVCYDGGNGLIAGCECYDRDGDNDVDGAGNGLIAGCECYDRDGDNDVDGADFTAFTGCFSGANVAADAACDD